MGIKEGTRYKLADKRKRNAAVVAYKQANPDATWRDIAAVFGISHVRVGAILRKANGISSEL